MADFSAYDLMSAIEEAYSGPDSELHFDEFMSSGTQSIKTKYGWAYRFEHGEDSNGVYSIIECSERYFKVNGERDYMNPTVHWYENFLTEVSRTVIPKNFWKEI